MGDELDDAALLSRVSPEMFRKMIDVMEVVYNKGYVNNTLTFQERQQVRAKTYQVLKALGLEK